MMGREMMHTIYIYIYIYMYISLVMLLESIRRDSSDMYIALSLHAHSFACMIKILKCEDDVEKMNAPCHGRETIRLAVMDPGQRQ